MHGQVSAEKTNADRGEGRPPGKGVGEIPEHARLLAPAQASTVAGTQSRGFQTETSRRLPSGATKTSDLYQNADGTVSRRIWSQPVNYKAPDGSWQPIDTTLVRRGGRVEMTAAGVKLSLAGAPGKSVAGETTADGTIAGEAARAGTPAELVSMTLSDGREFAFGLQDAAIADPEVAGDTATYRGVLPHTDFEVVALGGGAKDTLVLQSSQAANSWVFPLRLKGLQAVLSEGGAIELRDAAGAVAARIPRGYMQDSRFLENEGDFVKSDKVSYELVTLPGGGQGLKVTADRAWLNDPARVYPVRVDPAATVSADGDVTVDPDPNTGPADQNGNSIAVGWDGELVGNPLRNDIKNSYVSFGDFATATGEHPSLADKRIHSAMFNLFHTWTPTSACNKHRPVTIHAVTEPWTVDELDDSDRLPGVTTEIAKMLITNNYPACKNTSGNRTAGRWVSAGISDLRVIQRWSLGAPNFGLALMANGGDHAAFKRFTSQNFGGICAGLPCAPHIVFTYTDDTRPQIHEAYPPSGHASPTLTPELLALASDAEGNPITYQFEVFDSAGESVATSGDTANRSWTVPAGELEWSKSYTWAVSVRDDLGYGQPKYQVLTPTVPQPLITSKLSQNGGRGFEPSIGNYTTSVVDVEIPTVGPSLKVERFYNSRDFRTGAFGTGWSSVLDSRVTEGPRDTEGNLRWVTVTQPDGREITYARRADGSYAPPPGRYATLTETSSGFSLVDKQGLTFTYSRTPYAGHTVAAPTLVSIEDAQGRSLQVVWDLVPPFTCAGPEPCPAELAQARLEARYFQRDAQGQVVDQWVGRRLHLRWDDGVVRSVSSDPAVPDDDQTVSTWTYHYGQNGQPSGHLTSVRPPTSPNDGIGYEYGNNWLYPTGVHDLAPHTFLRLNETNGAAAASEVTDNSDPATGIYHEVTRAVAGPPGSTATAASFNGTSSLVRLADKAVFSSGHQTVSMWFKAAPGSSGVLYSMSVSPVPDEAATGHTPVLYIGSDGKLYGQRWNGAYDPIPSGNPVNDGAWHHVALTAAASIQELFVDGVSQGTRNGVITSRGETAFALGAGQWNGWPHTPTTTFGYLNGAISDFAVFTTALTAEQAASLYAAGAGASHPMTAVRRPSGMAEATISYDSSGVVTEVVDENGGHWGIEPAVLTGSSIVYAASVLGGAPLDYWRLADTGSPDMAKNEVSGRDATFNEVTLGGTEYGPFNLAVRPTAAKFNGTSSHIALSAEAPLNNGADKSVSLWFKMPAGSQAGGVLYAHQNAALGQAPDHNVPALYVGIDGKLRGNFWSNFHSPITVTTPVNDDKWHHVVLTADETDQQLYLDGRLAGTGPGTNWEPETWYGYIGAGDWSGWPGIGPGQVGYWPGSIAEVAHYDSKLGAADVRAQWAAYEKSVGQPTRSVSVIDPVQFTREEPKVTTYSYDPTQGRRIVEKVDQLGGRTLYGYDAGGFLRSTTDPNGNMKIRGHDVRGNVVSETVCQDRTWVHCGTTYFTYHPDATTLVLTPDPRNDQVLTVRDGRSENPDDPLYLTTFTYDAKGNRTQVTDPLGRRVHYAYTDGAERVPAGLTKSITAANGAETLTTYTSFGDIKDVSDPSGLRAEYVYNGIGWLTAKREVGTTTLTTTYRRDKVGRVVEQTDPATTNAVTGEQHQKSVETRFDLDGRVYEVVDKDLLGSDPDRLTTFAFDGQRLVQRATDPENGTQHFEYDIMGRLTKHVSPGGVATGYVYDELGRKVLTKLIGYTGNPNNPTPPVDMPIEARQYDPGGRLAAVVDAAGYRTEYTYYGNNLLENVVRCKPPQGQQECAPIGSPDTFLVENHWYDTAGNERGQITNNNRTMTEYRVDFAGRRTRETVDPLGLRRITTYEYTADNNLKSVTTLGGTQGYFAVDSIYDIAGRKISESIRNSGTTAGPAAWWKLDNFTGRTSLDSTLMGGNNLTATGDVSWTGAGARLPANSSLESAAPAVNPGQSFTVSAQVEAFTTATGQPAVSQRSASGRSFILGRDGARWMFRMYQDPSSYTTIISPNLPASARVTGVYDAPTQTMSLYVDNTLIQTKPVTTVSMSSGPTVLGGGYFDGRIDDVQVYQHALTPDKVFALQQQAALDRSLDSSITTSWQYDRRGNVAAEIDPNGNRTNYRYDAADRLVEKQRPLVTAEEFGQAPVNAYPITTTGYNSFGELRHSKDAKGRVITQVLDNKGRTVEVRLPSSGGTTPVHLIDYDGDDHVRSVTDPLNAVTSYRYDQLGNLVKQTAPDHTEATYTYDSLGRQLSATDPIGARTEATYDFLDRIATTTSYVRQPVPAQHTTTHTYDQAGRLKTVRSPLGVTDEYGYNTAGQVTSYKNPAGHVTSLSYDWAGRQSWMFPPTGAPEKLEYNAAGRVAAHRLYAAGPNHGEYGAEIDVESFGYDANGNLTSKTDFRGNTKTFAYDATGLLRSQTEPVSATESITSSFGHDLTGAPTRFTDGRGNPFWTTYNEWGLTASQIDPATAAHPNVADRTYSAVYDAAGRVRTQSLPGGVHLTFDYDPEGMGYLERISGTGAEAATADRTFGYDDAGRMTGFSAPGGTNTLSYDDRGLLLSVTGPSGNSSFGYDGDGRMSSRVDTAGTTTYDYLNGLLSTVSNPAAGVRLDVTYNPMDQVETVTYGGNGNVRRFGYDDRHRLITDQLKSAAGTQIATITYGWDDNGNETSKTTLGFGAPAANVYEYDQANRLTSWTKGSATTTYAYDKSGNRTLAGGKTFSYNERNQLVSASPDGTTYSYTPRGTLRSSTTGTVTLNTESNAFDEVVKQYHTAAGFSEYSYDGLGRVLKPGFAYSGLENDLAADGTATYTRDPIGGLLGVAQGGSGVLAWTDLHQDVVGQFTATGAALSGSAEYSPLGKVLASSAMKGNLGYQSEWTDLSTGRVNMHARWYNPDTGQFDSRDTWTLSASPDSVNANRYSYANQEPLLGTDPTGHHRPVEGGGDPVFDTVLPGCSDSTFERWISTLDPCTNKPPEEACNGPIGCFIDGLFGNLDFVPAVQAMADFLSMLNSSLDEIWKSFKEGAEALKAQAAEWSNKMVGHFGWLAFNDTVVEAVGWLCVLSNACKGLIDCFGGGSGSCYYHAGAAIGAVLMAIVSDGGKVLTDLLKNLAQNAFKKKDGDGNGKDGSETTEAPPHKATPNNRPPEERDWDKPPADNGSGTGSKGGDGKGKDPDTDKDGDTDTFSPETCEIHSFDPATPVLMADGSAKPIGEVHIGDEVVATDPVTGETSAQEVTALHANLDLALTNVTIGEGEGDRSTRGPTAQTLRTTDNHPFWDATTGSWVDAAELVPGESTVVDTAGNTRPVQAVDSFSGATLMRDLTVANVHTYYVLADDEPVLVHNVGGKRIPCEGDVDAFGIFTAVVGDELTPNHMPQNALHWLPRNEGLSIVMKHFDHLKTRTYGGKGKKTARDDWDKGFRDVLALDIWDLRRIAWEHHGDRSYYNASIRELLRQYREKYPHLMDRNAWPNQPGSGNNRRRR